MILTLSLTLYLVIIQWYLRILFAGTASLHAPAKTISRAIRNHFYFVSIDLIQHSRNLRRYLLTWISKIDKELNQTIRNGMMLSLIQFLTCDHFGFVCDSDRPTWLAGTVVDVVANRYQDYYLQLILDDSSLSLFLSVCLFAPLLTWLFFLIEIKLMVHCFPAFYHLLVKMCARMLTYYL